MTGTKALDFGCGAGRSTRFLRKLGFNATGRVRAKEKPWPMPRTGERGA
ncbi:MAG: hypothetical protein ACHP9S_10750 [Terriglobales bacterium]